MNFLIGACSGMIATCCIQPIDYVKVQIQIRSEAGERGLSPFRVAREVYADTGKVSTFYRGLDSALLRQILYASTRLGLFYTIKDRIIKTKGRQPTVVENALASLTSGAIGAFCGNPADLALVRMQADLNSPVEERRNYKHVGDALMRTVREEGVFTLWRGSTPTVIRAMAMNFSLLVPFEFAKKKLEPYVEHTKTRTIISSMIAGACGSVAALPFDNVKTKLQKMKPNSEGVMPYKGVLDCITKTAAREGFFRLWVGLGTFYTRIAPHAIISLVANDLLRMIFMPPATPQTKSVGTKETK